MPRLGLIDPLGGPCPPDGYRWKCPLDGWTSHAWDYRTWVEQAGSHFNANPGHQVFTGEQMEEQLCATLPPGWCNYIDPNRRRPSTQLDWNDVLRGSESIARWLSDGRNIVDKEEANRRALICTRCYLNVPMGGCSMCQAAVQKLAATLPPTRHDQALSSCAACKCNLRLKVHFTQEILDKENPGVQELYPDHCWLKKGGANYVEPHLSGGGVHPVRAGHV